MEVIGWWEWPPASITWEIVVAPLKSSGLQAKTAPTIHKRPAQKYFFCRFYCPLFK